MIQEKASYKNNIYIKIYILQIIIIFLYKKKVEKKLQKLVFLASKQDPKPCLIKRKTKNKNKKEY